MPLPPFPGNPDFGQPEGTPFEEAPNLAVALMLITEELRRRDCSTPAPKLAKAKEPDTFDGSDPKKLNNFIFLCNLYFRTNPSYEDDATKVTFALSYYLHGLALEYFEPSILDSDETPDWIDNWSAFVRTLRTQFDSIDPTRYPYPLGRVRPPSPLLFRPGRAHQGYHRPARETTNTRRNEVCGTFHRCPLLGTTTGEILCR